MKKKYCSKLVYVVALLAIYGGTTVALAQSAENLKTENLKNKNVSIQYFNKMAKVLQSPRCLNCHPRGNQPLQGDDMHVHIMNVQRGLENHGAIGMKCATCHGTENNLNSGVPGAPKWGLAPRNLAWVGLTVHDLCMKIRDPKKNGGMSLEKLIHHNGEDKLVGWAWNPGPNHVPAPSTQQEFGEDTRKWVESGAVCP